MFRYNWNEIISHFIGIFEVNTEEARLRAEYDKFRADGQGPSDQPDLPLFSPDVKAPHDLGDADPGPFGTPDSSQKAAVADTGRDTPSEWTPMEGVAGAPEPSPERDFTAAPPSDAPNRSPHDDPRGPDPDPRDITPDPDGPTLTREIGEGGSSVAAVGFQLNLLDDNDVLVTGGEHVDFTSAAYFDAGLATLTGMARGLDPLGLHAPPSSDAAIGDLVLEIAEAIVADPPPLTDAAVPDAVVFRDDAAHGVRVDGAEAEDLPVWRDHMPARLAPPEEDERLQDDGPPTVKHGSGPPQDDPAPPDDEEPDWGAAHQLSTGSNTLVNETAITTDWGDASVLAIMGDSRSVDVISQVNVWSDNDRITGFTSPTPEFDKATVALNAASILKADSAPAPAQASAATAAGVSWPQHWTVDHMDGDLVNLNWARQTNYITDHDVTSVAFSGNQTWIQAGGNTASNAFSAVEISRSYDLIVAEGDLVTANVIRQMNVLMDDDLVEMDALYSGLLATRDNLLMNRAEIEQTGAQTRTEMTDAYKTLAEDLRDDAKSVGQDILSDAAFEGLGLLRILHVGGDILNLQYIEQTNVLGDADQVTLAASRAAADAMADAAVSTGANALLNLASIRDARGDAEIHVRGEIYSDALLHQASLVSETDPELTIGDPSAMASEAVAFLADGMLPEDDLSGPDARQDAFHHSDAPDVMQTMLS